MTVDIAMLSEAQRAAIVDGLARYVDPNTIRALRRKGLVESRSIMLTMRGLEARALLLKDNSDAG